MFSSTIYDFFAANSIGKYLLEHEHQSYCIVVGYVLFVIWLGPSWMRTRKPFDLKIPMILYNFIMSALNFVLMIQVYQHLADTWDVRCIKDAPLYQQKIQDRMFIPWNAIFEKHFAFFDTIFFMLRKKQNQLTFLHVYHHTVTCLVVLWFAVTQDLRTGHLACWKGCPAYPSTTTEPRRSYADTLRKRDPRNNPEITQIPTQAALQQRPRNQRKPPEPNPTSAAHTTIPEVSDIYNIIEAFKEIKKLTEEFPGLLTVATKLKESKSKEERKLILLNALLE
ncbi:Elongation of very long chain fatty acids like protein [Argiope bruennichi]|uniref:Elongation of very long chain fatty acids protein n=1 Tax=Argiope bruennichi TaxID=94029 RepID=A0A8T0FX27_ARGBR|nr:Elongation of very long chain fatty acids like protein [Argiope bruennichi]